MAAADPGQSGETSDRDLVRQARRGSLASADALLDRHWSRAWKAAYAVLGDRTSAEDAAQSAVERAFRNLHRFDEGRPFGPWLARIAVNQALNSLRSRRDEIRLGDHHAGPDLYADVLDRDEVVRAVASLAPERRVVVALRYWADLLPAEIAGLLEIPVGTVTSRLARALNDLRAVLSEVESR